MRKMTWVQWLISSSEPVYLLINTLANPNPINVMYANDWIEKAFPLYYRTPLAHLIAQSPWLVQIKPESHIPLSQLLDSKTFSDDSWGWAYRSQLSWDKQLLHWQVKQVVHLSNESVLLRLADTRIARILIPEMIYSDWRSLMMPIRDILIDLDEPTQIISLNKEIEFLDPILQQRPFILDAHLIRAWQNSKYALTLYIENLSCELWENIPQQAQLLDTPEGILNKRISDWLQYQRNKLADLNFLTYQEFQQHAESQGWLVTQRNEK